MADSRKVARSTAVPSRGRGGQVAQKDLRAAVFFAGIGLLSAALEKEGFRTAFANDIEESKYSIYKKNFEPDPYELKDVREVKGKDVPDVTLATASFPCTDLSLAGGRAGLEPRPRGRGAWPKWKRESSMFWEFARVLEEMGRRRPPLVLLENVPGFASSRGGADLRDAIAALNSMGYWCDLFVGDARWFVPQSRMRMFLVGSPRRLDVADWRPTRVRPPWIKAFAEMHPRLLLHTWALDPPRHRKTHLEKVVERPAHNSRRWWDEDRLARFIDSLSPLHEERLSGLMRSSPRTWASAYRRMRDGDPVWEIRGDGISGCLRSYKGGSSKQALVEAGRGHVRVRWMSPLEYARLQGAPHLVLDDVPAAHAYFGLGDAVCVPVIRWIVRSYLKPLLKAGA